MIDMHTHSNASDGELSPYNLVKYAKEIGLSAIALCDHDTIDGLDDFLRAGKDFKIETIPSIEISADYKSEMHILGFFINKDDPALIEASKQLKEFRIERNIITTKLLNDLGFDITYEEVLEKSNGSVGRVHFAMVMVEKGYIESVKEAFSKYLGSNKPAYYNRQKFSPKETIELILKAGGLPTLAHPLFLSSDENELDNLLCELKSYGLYGVECYYNSHSPEDVKLIKKLASKHNLHLSGGSDFHGINKPHVALGKVFGNESIPYSVFENFIKGD